jgi:glycine dehydrogenase
MLSTVGVKSVDELIDQTIPASIRLPKPLDLPAAMSERELLEHLQQVGSKNKVWRSYIGMGYYDTLTPPVILRNIVENPGWYTQYTPYQAEISQGRLESLLNFQTMVIDLTGLEIANASLLDEATAAAEAMHLMIAARSKALAEDDASVLFVDSSTFPHVLDVLYTRAEPLGIEIRVGDYRTAEFDGRVFGAYIQYPAADGTVRDYRSFVERAHAAEVLVAVGTDLLALTMIEAPGVWGADVCVGSAQRFGVPLGYGGPHAAFMSTKDAFKRVLPGRIIGVSIDAQNNVGLRMALQTREQHIRRDKATSNICTAQALLANVAAMYAVYHGPAGLHAIAAQTHAHAASLAAAVKGLGYTLAGDEFFDTITVVTDKGAAIRAEAEKREINLRYADGVVGVSFDETTTAADVADVIACFAAAAAAPAPATPAPVTAISSGSARTTTYMTHPVFNTYHTEHEMLRYMKRLENKDLSLVHSMIPLGSCTMKLNATAEMMPITWPSFNRIHPFAPRAQAAGYSEIFTNLEKWLNEITGFDATSLQPNAGAQGEYAGLLVIRAFHRANGNANRDIVLIPSSAHGTNPASAVMAGMTVVVVKATEEGHIDLQDLRAKAEEHKEDLAALMVTYPSTHGVFEDEIREICDIIHTHGGRVYMDGANMNAQVGLTSPRAIGADVCHLNLHKTFCIPHGGGGPGMGPICCTAELAPYLPKHSVVDMDDLSASRTRAVSAAPWGSASILLISYAYIAMMGPDGLTAATKAAILNANYIKARLEKHYPILYSGSQGRCAHEMIVDLRGFKQRGGIEAEDVAKRLMDYGFHAPTLSFPVPGTIMIEPTESESKGELDRFCDALLSIHAEMEAVISGAADKTDNVLKNAPHTQFVAIADEWSHPYSRQQAVFPLPWVRDRKFWPSIGRVNNSQGDRVLICACPPIEEYM